MNRSLFVIYLVLIFSGFSASVHAYEEDTHDKLSEAAAKSSVLTKDQSLLNGLGIVGDEKFKNSKDEDKSIVELIRDGSKFEDSAIRPLFHFFDPVHDEGLLFFTSPTWALEDKGKIHFLQNYSFGDARDSFYGALTSTSGNERKAKFGKTFEALGRVIHHVQDMAQPQHVRLDDHLRLDFTQEELPIEKRSRYEEYTKSKSGNLPFGTYATVNSQNDINFLTTARSFWTTGRGKEKGLAEYTNRGFVSAGTNFDDKSGRYTSPYFDPNTEWEANANELLQQAGEQIPSECLPPNPPCYMTFYRNEVKDSYRPTETKINDKASTWSVFDQDLKAYNKTYTKTDPETGQTYTTNSAFSLNRFNFDEAHKFLIPRAVAYSTGLLDYFFRGKLEAQDAGFTDTGISLKVKNAIDPKALPAWKDETLSGGDLVLAYEYRDASGNKHYAKSATAALQAPLLPGEAPSNIYSFTLNPPDDARELKYRLVYRGKIGQEEGAVAVGQTKPVGGFLVSPNYTPADGIGGARMIYKQGGRWKLSSDTGMQAGNIDWKGFYVNGKPTKVLTWEGPYRYFPGSRGLREFDYAIYQNGEVLSWAPYYVLGAALTKDATGQEWIVTICSDGYSDIVYKRPNKKIENSWDFHDPVTNPDGWQKVAQLDPADGMATPDRAWHFNGSGTEAQTMRRKRDTSNNGGKEQLIRLEFTLTPDLAGGEIKPRGNLSGFLGTTSCAGGYDANGYGSATRVVRDSGEYIIAVDYKNDRMVTASVRRDATLKTESSVSSEASTTVETTVLSETLQWEGPAITILQDNSKRSGVLSKASNTYTLTSSGTGHQTEISYYLDLRYDLYSFYEYSVTYDDSATRRDGVITGSSGQYTQTEKDRIVSNLGPELTAFSSSRSFGYQPTFRELGVLGCTSGTWSDTGYASNFGWMWPDPVGSWVVDGQGNLLVSQVIYSDLGYKREGIYNFITGGSLDTLIPGGDLNAIYLSTGVVR